MEDARSEVAVKAMEIAETADMEVITTTTKTQIIIETDMETKTTKNNKETAVAGHMNSWQNYVTNPSHDIQNMPTLG